MSLVVRRLQYHTSAVGGAYPERQGRTRLRSRGRVVRGGLLPRLDAMVLFLCLARHNETHDARNQGQRGEGKSCEAQRVDGPHVVVRDAGVDVQAKL
eukprot:365733-Chlamydomonas_euryale.AAC.14